MADLFWPGDERAGALLSEGAFLEAMVAVEQAWLDGLVEAGIAPAAARHELAGVVRAADITELALAAEAGGNPVIGLVRLLRHRVPAEPARWVHRGLTSQDVVDTALALALDRVVVEVLTQLRDQVRSLCRLAETHASTSMVGRTLTQHAVPITFGLRAAVWLNGILDAADGLAHARTRLAVQVGGAAGSLAGPVELASATGDAEPGERVEQILTGVAARLGLPLRPPWHTVRTPFTAVGDALVTCTDAFGHLAADVATGSRPEIGEVHEGTGGGSSTMPDKRNPVLAVLVRRAALAGPGLAATLHLASASVVDERPDGAWHVEWAALRDLGRRTVVAASQTAQLLAELRIDDVRMAANLARAEGIDAEQRSLAAAVGIGPTSGYRGLTDSLIAAAVTRGREFLDAGDDA